MSDQPISGGSLHDGVINRFLRRAREGFACQPQKIEVAREASNRRLGGLGHRRLEALDLAEHGRGVKEEVAAVPQISFRQIIRGGRGIGLLHERLDRACGCAIELLPGADVAVTRRWMGGLDAECDDPPLSGGGGGRWQTSRNSSGLRTTWSAASTSTRALRSRWAASKADTATAGPESRPTGSSTMSASKPRPRNCSATTNRKSVLVMTIGRPNKLGSEIRPSACWNVDPSPTSETNCLGMLSRETGHSRVPAPPHMITGMI
jgi:hypothetical protein